MVTQTLDMELTDHIPVKITLNSSLQIYQKNDSLIKGKLDWIKFSNNVQSSLIIPKTISTIQTADQTADHFTEVVTDAARACYKPCSDKST